MNRFTVQLVETTIKVDLQNPIDQEQATEILKQVAELGCALTQCCDSENCDLIARFEFDFFDMPIDKKQVLEVFDICFIALMLG